MDAEHAWWKFSFSFWVDFFLSYFQPARVSSSIRQIAEHPTAATNRLLKQQLIPAAVHTDCWVSASISLMMLASIEVAGEIHAANIKAQHSQNKVNKLSKHHLQRVYICKWKTVAKIASIFPSVPLKSQ